MDPFSIGLLALGAFGALGNIATSSYQVANSAQVSDEALKKQYKYQRLLNAQQQDYAQINASQAYKRQRELMQDSASLTKLGLQQAGMSTAGLDKGASAPVVSQAEAAPSGSAPSASVPVSSLNSALGALSSSFSQMSSLGVDSLVKKRQADLLESQKKAQEITNLTLGAKNEAEIWKLVESGKLDKTQAERILFDLGIQKETRSSQVESIVQEAINKRLEGVLKTEQIQTERVRREFTQYQSQLTQKQIDELSKKLEWYDREMKAKLENIIADTWLKKYSWDKVSSEAEYLSNLADKVNIEKLLAEAKLPFAPEMAQLLRDQMKSQLTLLGQKIQIAIEEAKAKKFENEHQMATFIKNQITSYLNSTAFLVGSFGTFFGGSVAPPADGTISIPGAQAPDWTATPATPPYI